LIKTGAWMVRHARYAIFQMVETALPQFKTEPFGVIGLNIGLLAKFGQALLTAKIDHTSQVVIFNLVESA
jgi:hypothetical protein